MSLWYTESLQCCLAGVGKNIHQPAVLSIDMPSLSVHVLEDRNREIVRQE